MPLVSVIIPIFNTAQYLPYCLDSVLSQSFTDYEVILVNDGSTDDSLYICSKYRQLNSCIRVYSQENLGVSAARNLGIDVAIGKWCCFIDSDDYVSNDYIEKLVDHISSENSMILTNVEYGRNIVVPSLINGNFAGSSAIRDYIWKNGIARHLGPYAKLFNLNIINSQRIRFPENIYNGEDSIFVFTYLTHVGTLTVYESRNYNYRYVEGSLSNRILPEKKALENYVGQKESWLNFMDLKIEDSQAWINSPIQPMLNTYVLSLFADKQLNLDYRLKQVKKLYEELLSMYRYSEIKTSTIARISTILLSCHLYIIYIMCYCAFVRYHLHIKIR